MQAVITHPQGVQAGVESAAAGEALPVSLAEIENIIPRSAACTSVERLNVYAGAYYARLLECLRDFFPVLVYALGEDLFNQFAFGYLQRYPSQSYTLNRLADNFVAYLEETRPSVPCDEAPSGQASQREVEFARWQEFVIDLARLEWSIDQVFDGPGSEGEPLLTIEQIAAIPPGAWPEARLEPSPCLRLLAFRYPVNDYFTAFRRGEQPARPAPAESRLALTRRDYVVRRHPLTPPQYALLSALVAGETVAEAIAAAAELHDDVEHLATELHDWFRGWSSSGFFRRINV